MTIFKAGDFVVPANKAEEESILRQYQGKPKGPFPWVVKRVENSPYEDSYFLRFDHDIGYYSFRFVKAAPVGKDLEDYM